MKAKLSLLALALSAHVPAVNAADDLLITEYIEGSSNNKAIEIYNPTSNVIDLSAYQLKMYFNGNTSAGRTIQLDGNLAANSVYVVSHSSSADEMQAVSDLLTGGSFFNGDDVIALINGNTVVDSIGKLGEDPGSQWGSGLVSTKDNTLRRNPEILIADTNLDDDVTFDSWLGFEKNNWADLGSFDGSSITPPDPDPEPNPNPELGQCGDDFTKISAVQGTSDTSPVNGETLPVEGIVTSIQSGLKGFYIQSADSEADADSDSSEGVFVFTDQSPIDVQVGDRVRLLAKVEEFNGLTELKNITGYEVCGSDQTLPLPASVSLPVESNNQLETVEGMRVTFSHPLVVNDVFNLSRYGEVVLGSHRHFIPTQIANPGEAAALIAAANAKDTIILEDGLTSQNPESIPFPTPELSASNTVRVGDSITELTALVHYAFNNYRLIPSEAVDFVQSNQRTVAPVISTEGNITVASFNVLNYFNGNGSGGGFPTPRGADSLSEFERQEAKIVSALKAINADVFGLIELENDGFDNQSAIASLTAALNAQSDNPSYQFVNPNLNTIGDDAITVGLIYRADKLTPEGVAGILSSDNSPQDAQGQPLFLDSKNRPMLTQSFVVNGSSEHFAVAVNHLKSKGSNCDSLGDPDLSDGQANCNLTRTRAAQAIGQWLPQAYPDQGIIILGDLNAYAKEDPLNALANAGYTAVFDQLEKPASHSYVFRGESGQLDHALTNQALAANLVDITDWHINADEPRALDYNEEFKSESQKTNWYAADAYRSSDHDPVVVRLNFDLSTPFAEYAMKPRRGAAKLNVELPESVVWGDIIELVITSVDGSASHLIQQRIAKRRAAEGVVPVKLDDITELGEYRVSAKLYVNPNGSKKRDGDETVKADLGKGQFTLLSRDDYRRNVRK